MRTTLQHIGEQAALALGLAAIVLGTACGPRAPEAPGTQDGAREVLAPFLDAGADTAALTAALRPQDADYAAYFEGTEAVAAARRLYDRAWDGGDVLIAPRDGQTELLVWVESTDNLRAGIGNTNKFPGAYREAARRLRPGNVVARFRFVAPGKDVGMAYDGLAYVNGHWAFFPKPWRVLE